jgi:hypothetical protein
MTPYTRATRQLECRPAESSCQHPAARRNQASGPLRERFHGGRATGDSKPGLSHGPPVLDALYRFLGDNVPHSGHRTSQHLHRGPIGRQNRSTTRRLRPSAIPGSPMSPGREATGRDADRLPVATRSEASITAVIGTASASRPITKTGNRNEKTSGPPGTGALRSTVTRTAAMPV